MDSSRSSILTQVKQAIQNPSHMPDEKIEGIENRIKDKLKSITPKAYFDSREQFKKELEAVSGEFHVFKSKKEIIQFLKDFLTKNDYKILAHHGAGLCAEIAETTATEGKELKVVNAVTLDYAERREALAGTDITIVDAAFAIADTGSLAVIVDDTPSLLPYYLPECVFVIVTPVQLLSNIFELFEIVPRDKAGNLMLITGPSRTADIEKILILGAHGPRCLVVGMYEE